MYDNAMKRGFVICNVVVLTFAAFYVAALLVFLTGTFSWFGQATDPLSGVFLLPLGLPWVLGVEGAPDSVRPWLAALAPLLNLAVLVWVCRRVRK